MSPIAGALCLFLYGFLVGPSLQQTGQEAVFQSGSGVQTNQVLNSTTTKTITNSSGTFVIVETVYQSNTTVTTTELRWEQSEWYTYLRAEGSIKWTYQEWLVYFRRASSIEWNYAEWYSYTSAQLEGGFTCNSESIALVESAMVFNLFAALNFSLDNREMACGDLRASVQLASSIMEECRMEEDQGDVWAWDSTSRMSIMRNMRALHVREFRTMHRLVCSTPMTVSVNVVENSTSEVMTPMCDADKIKETMLSFLRLEMNWEDSRVCSDVSMAVAAIEEDLQSCSWEMRSTLSLMVARMQNAQLTICTPPSCNIHYADTCLENAEMALAELNKGDTANLTIRQCQSLKYSMACVTNHTVECQNNIYRSVSKRFELLKSKFMKSCTAMLPSPKNCVPVKQNVSNLMFAMSSSFFFNTSTLCRRARMSRNADVINQYCGPEDSDTFYCLSTKCSGNNDKCSETYIESCSKKNQVCAMVVDIDSLGRSIGIKKQSCSPKSFCSGQSSNDGRNVCCNDSSLCNQLDAAGEPLKCVCDIDGAIAMLQNSGTGAVCMDNSAFSPILNYLRGCSLSGRRGILNNPIVSQFFRSACQNLTDLVLNTSPCGNICPNLAQVKNQCEPGDGDYCQQKVVNCLGVALLPCAESDRYSLTNSFFNNAVMTNSGCAENDLMQLMMSSQTPVLKKISGAWKAKMCLSPLWNADQGKTLVAHVRSVYECLTSIKRKSVSEVKVASFMSHIKDYLGNGQSMCLKDKILENSLYNASISVLEGRENSFACSGAVTAIDDWFTQCNSSELSKTDIISTLSLVCPSTVKSEMCDFNRIRSCYDQAMKSPEGAQQYQTLDECVRLAVANCSGPVASENIQTTRMMANASGFSYPYTSSACMCDPAAAVNCIMDVHHMAKQPVPDWQGLCPMVEQSKVCAHSYVAGCDECKKSTVVEIVTKLNQKLEDVCEEPPETVCPVTKALECISDLSRFQKASKDFSSETICVQITIASQCVDEYTENCDQLTVLSTTRNLEQVINKWEDLECKEPEEQVAACVGLFEVEIYGVLDFSMDNLWEALANNDTELWSQFEGRCQEMELAWKCINASLSMKKDKIEARIVRQTMEALFKAVTKVCKPSREPIQCYSCQGEGQKSCSKESAIETCKENEVCQTVTDVFQDNYRVKSKGCKPRPACKPACYANKCDYCCSENLCNSVDNGPVTGSCNLTALAGCVLELGTEYVESPDFQCSSVDVALGCINKQRTECEMGGMSSVVESLKQLDVSAEVTTCLVKEASLTCETEQITATCSYISTGGIEIGQNILCQAIAESRKSVSDAKEICTDGQYTEIRRTQTSLESLVGSLDCDIEFGFIVENVCEPVDALACVTTVLNVNETDEITGLTCTQFSKVTDCMKARVKDCGSAAQLFLVDRKISWLQSLLPSGSDCSEKVELIPDVELPLTEVSQCLKQYSEAMSASPCSAAYSATEILKLCLFDLDPELILTVTTTDRMFIEIISTFIQTILEININLTPEVELGSTCVANLGKIMTKHANNLFAIPFLPLHQRGKVCSELEVDVMSILNACDSELIEGHFALLDYMRENFFVGFCPEIKPIPRCLVRRAEECLGRFTAFFGRGASEEVCMEASAFVECSTTYTEYCSNDELSSFRRHALLAVDFVSQACKDDTQLVFKARCTLLGRQDVQPGCSVADIASCISVPASSDNCSDIEQRAACLVEKGGSCLQSITGVDLSAQADELSQCRYGESSSDVTIFETSCRMPDYTCNVSRAHLCLNDLIRKNALDSADIEANFLAAKQCLSENYYCFASVMVLINQNIEAYSHLVIKVLDLTPDWHRLESSLLIELLTLPSYISSILEENKYVSLNLWDVCWNLDSVLVRIENTIMSYPTDFIPATWRTVDSIKFTITKLCDNLGTVAQQLEFPAGGLEAPGCQEVKIKATVSLLMSRAISELYVVPNIADQSVCNLFRSVQEQLKANSSIELSSCSSGFTAQVQFGMKAVETLLGNSCSQPEYERKRCDVKMVKRCVSKLYKNLQWLGRNQTVQGLCKVLDETEMCVERFSYKCDKCSSKRIDWLFKSVKKSAQKKCISTDVAPVCKMEDENERISQCDLVKASKCSFNQFTSLLSPFISRERRCRHLQEQSECLNEATENCAGNLPKLFLLGSDKVEDIQQELKCADNDVDMNFGCRAGCRVDEAQKCFDVFWSKVPERMLGRISQSICKNINSLRFCIKQSTTKCRDDESKYVYQSLETLLQKFPGFEDSCVDTLQCAIDFDILVRQIEDLKPEEVELDLSSGSSSSGSGSNSNDSKDKSVKESSVKETKKTAKSTKKTAEGTKKTVKETKKTAKSTKKTTEGTKKTVKETKKTAVRTKRAAKGTKKTAKSTKKTSEGTVKTAKSTKKTSKGTVKTAKGTKDKSVKETKTTKSTKGTKGTKSSGSNSSGDKSHSSNRPNLNALCVRVKVAWTCLQSGLQLLPEAKRNILVPLYMAVWEAVEERCSDTRALECYYCKDKDNSGECEMETQTCPINKRACMFHQKLEGSKIQYTAGCTDINSCYNGGEASERTDCCTSSLCNTKEKVETPAVLEPESCKLTYSLKCALDFSTRYLQAESVSCSDATMNLGCVQEYAYSCSRSKNLVSAASKIFLQLAQTKCIVNARADDCYSLAIDSMQTILSNAYISQGNSACIGLSETRKSVDQLIANGKCSEAAKISLRQVMEFVTTIVGGYCEEDKCVATDWREALIGRAQCTGHIFEGIKSIYKSYKELSKTTIDCGLSAAHASKARNSLANCNIASFVMNKLDALDAQIESRCQIIARASLPQICSGACKTDVIISYAEEIAVIIKEKNSLSCWYLSQVAEAYSAYTAGCNSVQQRDVVNRIQFALGADIEKCKSENTEFVFVLELKRDIYYEAMTCHLNFQSAIQEAFFNNNQNSACVAVSTLKSCQWNLPTIVEDFIVGPTKMLLETLDSFNICSDLGNDRTRRQVTQCQVERLSDLIYQLSIPPHIATAPMESRRELCQGVVSLLKEATAIVTECGDGLSTFQRTFFTALQTSVQAKNDLLCPVLHYEKEECNLKLVSQCREEFNIIAGYVSMETDALCRRAKFSLECISRFSQNCSDDNQRAEAVNIQLSTKAMIKHIVGNSCPLLTPYFYCEGSVTGIQAACRLEQAKECAADADFDFTRIDEDGFCQTLASNIDCVQNAVVGCQEDQISDLDWDSKISNSLCGIQDASLDDTCTSKPVCSTKPILDCFFVNKQPDDCQSFSSAYACVSTYLDIHKECDDSLGSAFSLYFLSTYFEKLSKQCDVTFTFTIPDLYASVCVESLWTDVHQALSFNKGSASQVMSFVYTRLSSCVNSAGDIYHPVLEILKEMVTSLNIYSTTETLLSYNNETDTLFVDTSDCSFSRARACVGKQILETFTVKLLTVEEKQLLCESWNKHSTRTCVEEALSECPQDSRDWFLTVNSLSASAIDSLNICMQPKLCIISEGFECVNKFGTVLANYDRTNDKEALCVGRLESKACMDKFLMTCSDTKAQPVRSAFQTLSDKVEATCEEVVLPPPPICPEIPERNRICSYGNAFHCLAQFSAGLLRRGDSLIWRQQCLEIQKMMVCVATNTTSCDPDSSNVGSIRSQLDNLRELAGYQCPWLTDNLCSKEAPCDVSKAGCDVNLEQGLINRQKTLCELKQEADQCVTINTASCTRAQAKAAQAVMEKKMKAVGLPKDVSCDSGSIDGCLYSFLSAARDIYILQDNTEACTILTSQFSCINNRFSNPDYSQYIALARDLLQSINSRVQSTKCSASDPCTETIPVRKFAMLIHQLMLNKDFHMTSFCASSKALLLEQESSSCHGDLYNILSQSDVYIRQCLAVETSCANATIEIEKCISDLGPVASLNCLDKIKAAACVSSLLPVSCPYDSSWLSEYMCTQTVVLQASGEQSKKNFISEAGLMTQFRWKFQEGSKLFKLKMTSSAMESETVPRCLEGSKVNDPIPQIYTDMNSKELGENDTDITFNIYARQDYRKDGVQSVQVEFTVVPYELIENATGEEAKKELTESAFRLAKYTVEIEDRDMKKSVCSSINDPHIKTFDGIKFNNMGLGSFILYRHTEKATAVVAQYKQCSAYGSCNCGATVYAGKSRVTFDLCNENSDFISFKSETGADSLAQQQLRMFSEEDLQTYYVILLATGTIVKIRAEGSYMNIWVTPSALDIGSTQGLCGVYDGDGYNDFELPDFSEYKVSSNDTQFSILSPNTFNQAWRISRADSQDASKVFANGVEISTEVVMDSCFSWESAGEEISKCGSWAHLAPCGFVGGEDKISMLLEKYRQDQSSAVRTKRAVEEDDDDTILSEPTWPTQSGWTREAATEFCLDNMYNKPLEACREAVQSLNNTLESFDLDDPVDFCVDDIRLSDGTSWIEGARQAAAQLCLEELNQNPQYQNDKDSSDLAIAFVDMTCTPFDCNSHGTCNRGRCICNKDYAGTNCDIHIDDLNPPSLFLAESGVHMCEIGDESECSTVYISGKNFVSSNHLTCHVKEVEMTTTGVKHAVDAKTHLVEGEMISSSQVRCDLGSKSIMKRTLHVSISNDGEKEDPNYQLFIAFDPMCYSCSAYSCFKRNDVCFIGNKCVREGESSVYNDCQYCNLMSPNKWTVRDVRGCEGFEADDDDDDTDHLLTPALIGAGCALLILVIALIIALIFIIKRRDARRRRDMDRMQRYDNTAFEADGSPFHGQPITAHKYHDVPDNLKGSAFPEYP